MSVNLEDIALYVLGRIGSSLWKNEYQMATQTVQA